MNKDEALKMAIEALDDIELCDYQTQQKAIKACKEALAQQAQEPWGWYENHDIYDEKQSNDSIALYTHPAPSNGMDKPLFARVVPWQGLSDDKINVIWDDVSDVLGFAKAIEAELKEKNAK